MKTYTLLDLQTYIRRVIAANMQDAVWITAELSSCGEVRGHWYLDLIEKDDAAITAQVSAVLWASTFKILQKKLGAKTLNTLLNEGVQVRMEVRVEYHERYGMKLVIQDLDPAYTLGQLEAQRRESLQKLNAQGLLQQQKKLKLPAVVQRVALISASGAAGYQDFIQHLNHNIYGYKFAVTLFDSNVQGDKAVSDILQHFAVIAKNHERFDAICILRGGGSRLDLVAFDDYNMAAAAAVLPLPLLVGIGHEIDESVLDAVAFLSLKTPTAVADFLIDLAANFESKLQQQEQQLYYLSNHIFKKIELEQSKIEQHLQFVIAKNIKQKELVLEKIAAFLTHTLSFYWQKQQQNLDLLTQKIDLLQPEKILKRGFSMALYQNKPILNTENIPQGAIIETITHKGKLESKVL